MQPVKMSLSAQGEPTSQPGFFNWVPSQASGSSETRPSMARQSLSLVDLVHNEVAAVTSALRRNLNRRGFASSAAYTQAAALALHGTFHGLPYVDPSSADPELVAVAAASLPTLTPSTLVSTTTMSLTMPALSAAARSFVSFRQDLAQPHASSAPPSIAGTSASIIASSRSATKTVPQEGTAVPLVGQAGVTASRSTPSAPADDPLTLLTRFTLLRAQLRTHFALPGAQLASFPLAFLVDPFLKVVLSPKTTGATTSIALASLQRLVVHGVIPPPRYELMSNGSAQLLPLSEQGELPGVVGEIAHALSHSRFEATTTSSSAESASSDELVLVRILDLMRTLIVSSAPGTSQPALADVLSDEAICELMETGLSMCCQTRLSDLLRKTAQAHMSDMLLAIFRHLDSIPNASMLHPQGTDGAEPHPSAGGSASLEAAGSHAGGPTLNASAIGPLSPAAEGKTHMRRMTMPDPSSLAIPAAANAEGLAPVSEDDAEGQDDGENETATTAPKPTEDEIDAVAAMQDASPGAAATAPAVIAEEPYGLPAITEILRVLAHLIDPHDTNNNDTMRLLSMQLLTPLLELTGTSISEYAELRSLLTEVAAKHLFQLARSSPGPSSGAGLSLAAAEANAVQLQMVGAALRAITTLFAAMKPHLKLQFELFVAFCLDRLAPTFPFTMEPWNEGALAKAAARRVQGSSNRTEGASGPSFDGGSALPPPPPPPPPPILKTSERAPATGETRELTLETFNMLFRGFERHGSGFTVAVGDASGSVPPNQHVGAVDGSANAAISGAEQSTPPSSIPEDVMVTLWVNYDCDAHCDDLYERVVRFLCRAIHATNPAHTANSSTGTISDPANSSAPALQDGTQVLALDAILNLISGMASRQETAEVEGAQGYSSRFSISPRDLAQRKEHKAAILEAASHFNVKPKQGVKWMAEQGLINDQGSDTEKARSLAAFLKDCPGLDKKLLGDYISRPENQNVLEAFISQFDFHGKSIADALRELLETFRLPGEAQQIARITETFAKIFFSQSPPEIASEDATYVLSYSVIMLNTDQHNPQNKRKMQVDDYRKNLRGVNDGKDFDPDYLGTIFDSIKKREIVMPEEHLGQLGFDFAWKNLVRRSPSTGLLLPCGTGHFDRPMFENSWRPIVASLAHAFSSFQDEYLLERSITGFRQCATLARKFGMNDVFDFMVHGLSAVTGLLDEASPSKPTNSNAQVDVDGQKVVVSPLSIRFGMNFKGQLAAVVLFTIANGNGDAIRSSWADIFEIFTNLFANTLLPESMLSMQDFTAPDGRSRIPLKAKKLPGAVPVDPRAQGGGLFSTLSSYLLAPMSAEKELAPLEVGDQDVESSLSTIDCVASCNLEDLYEQIKHLKGDALLTAVRSLQSLATRMVTQASKPDQASNGTPTPNQGTPNANRVPSNPRYDASTVFAMEMFADVACSDAEILPKTWSMLYDFVTAILAAPKAHHPLIVERAVVLTLRLASQAGVLISGTGLSASEQRATRDQLFLALDTIRSLPTETRTVTSLQLLGGLVEILKSAPPLAQSSTEWGLLLALIGDHSKGPNASATAINLGLQAVKQGISANVSAENILGFLSLLREYASEVDSGASGASSNAPGSPGGSKARQKEPSGRQTLTEKKEIAEADEARKERAVEAVSVLETLRLQIPNVIASSQIAYGDAWKQTWVTLLGAIASQCLSSHGPLRQAALTQSQRAFLCAEIIPVQPVEVRPIFDQVLFPVLNELTKARAARGDANQAGGLAEMRTRLCGLSCKLFLHLLTALAQTEADLQDVWLNLLDFMKQFMSGGPKDPLTEAIPENLKNVLLVMSASGILLPPAAPDSADSRSKTQAALWAVTMERLSQFLPDLPQEVFPPPPPPAPVAPPAEPAPAPALPAVPQDVEGESQAPEQTEVPQALSDAVEGPRHGEAEADK